MTINYVEENMTKEIDYGQMGRIACCSAYHFQRIFTYMAGIPLSEYIRKRKMSLAAVDLHGSDEKVIDIAIKYGYSSHKAFQSVHGKLHLRQPELRECQLKHSPPWYLKSL